jgi:putative ABC transport system ATP-binding protein
MAAVVATHDPVMIALADRVVRIVDGHLTDG